MHRTLVLIALTSCYSPFKMWGLNPKGDSMSLAEFCKAVYRDQSKGGVITLDMALPVEAERWAYRVSKEYKFTFDVLESELHKCEIGAEIARETECGGIEFLGKIIKIESLDDDAYRVTVK